MLIISVQEELFDDVVAMVHQLDEEARPRTKILVHRVNGGISAEHLQKALSEALGTPWPGGRPEKPEASAAEANQKPKGKNPKQAGEQPHSNAD